MTDTDPTPAMQFRSATHELAIGLAPVLTIGVVTMAVALALTDRPVVAPIAATAVMAVVLRPWLRFVTERSEGDRV